MLLIYNQHPQFLDGRKDSRAGADDNIGFPLADAMPLVIAFAITQSAMQ